MKNTSLMERISRRTERKGKRFQKLYVHNIWLHCSLNQRRMLRQQKGDYDTPQLIIISNKRSTLGNLPGSCSTQLHDRANACCSRSCGRPHEQEESPSPSPFSLYSPSFSCFTRSPTRSLRFTASVPSQNFVTEHAVHGCQHLNVPRRRTDGTSPAGAVRIPHLPMGGPMRRTKRIISGERDRSLRGSGYWRMGNP